MKIITKIATLCAMATLSTYAQTTLYSGNGTLASARTVTMSGNALTFSPTAANSQFFMNGSSGFIGLGNSLPAYRLDILGITRASNIWATNKATSATTFANNTAWYQNATVYSAGYEMTDPRETTLKRRSFNIYDFNGYNAQTISPGDDRLEMSFIDRANKERILFEAHVAGGVSNGVTNFAINDKGGVEFFKLLDNGSNRTWLQMNKSDSKLSIGTHSLYTPGLGHKLVVASGSAFVEGNVISHGNVGIGTSSFTDGADTFRLSVDGAVRADRVKVYTTWADYVFEKSYKLPTLKEVEDHIAAKGHLKDIPSAADVEENGIELGEMNKLLLQKIEELTLYVIELNKQVEALKSASNNK